MSPSSRDPAHPADRDRAPAASGIAWSDGRVVPAGEATVPLTDEGVLRGDAVFEAVLVRRGRTHALRAHLARMRRSAAAVDLELPDLGEVVTDLLLAWGERDGVLRLIVTRGGTVRGLLTTVVLPPSVALAVVEAPWRTALTGVKTLSYAVNQWAVRRAQALDADDALMVDDGRVLELPTGAACLVHDGRISSPDPTRLPILDSVTVRELARLLDIERTTPGPHDLRTADEAFVVSAARPVLGVHAIRLDAFSEIELPAPGPVTVAARDAFEAHVHASLDPLP